MEKKTKEVIIWRHDLKVRRGKQIAQGAHASTALLLNEMSDLTYGNGNKDLILKIKKDSPLDKWINGKFTKIVVYCKDEPELLQIYGQAKAARLPTVLITDAGLTEFKDVPTHTCVGIGPCWEEDVDKITGHLPLL